MRNNGPTKNLLICGDNLKVLDDLIKQGIRVDLIYLDPPFFSHKHYEVVWGDEAEVRSFKDRWAGGINVYIEWMKERIVKMYDVLKDTGSFYLHCDSHASHYLKVLLDGIFGISNFQNDIIWQRYGSHNDPKRFGRVTDSILFYSKSNSYTFNPIRVQYSEDHLTRRFRYKDSDGRRFWPNTCLAPGGRGPKYEWHGHIANWRFTREKMAELDKKGEIYYSKRGIPYRKNYLDSLPGQLAQNIWTDIKMTRSGRERLGYPTQKPEALLERIINASSNVGDIVLDPFCGCGTAMAVAQELGRKWIGIDISPTAIKLSETRLAKLGAIKGKDFDSIGMPTTVTELKSNDRNNQNNSGSVLFSK